MTGVEIEYFIGIFLAVMQLQTEKPYISNGLKFVVGLILFLLAVLQISFIR